MKQKKLPLKLLAATVVLFFCSKTQAQLSINSATLYIQPGATVSVQGNVTTNVDIQGDGKLLLNGTTNQSVDLKGTTIANLEIANTANATLASDVKIGKSLVFTNGKITLGNNNVTLADIATTTGQGAGKFLETNGTGQVIKQLTGNVTSLEVPVGNGTIYRPAFVTTNGSYSNASVGVRNGAAVDPNSPPKIADYVKSYWPITRTGITGTVTVAGQYDATDVTGTESNVKGYYFNGTDWSSTNGTANAGTNQVSAPINGAGGDVAGMNGFVLLNTKVFLQGAYNSSTGVMSTTLRTLPTFPLTDPYRNDPYKLDTAANVGIETISSTVLTDQINPNNNIVDWICLELRNTATSGNKILQTRAALLQADGDIVDIDGVSPVTFNNVLAGNYVVAVRHRNHLGLSINPATTSKALSETKSTATTLDYTTATSTNIFGTSGTNYGISTDSKNIMLAGNANANTGIRYSGGGNDPAYILSTVLGGNPNGSVPGYNVGDVNMNGTVRYSGGGNDASYILSTVLSSNPNGSKTQALPN